MNYPREIKLLRFFLQTNGTWPSDTLEGKPTYMRIPLAISASIAVFGFVKHTIDNFITMNIIDRGTSVLSTTFSIYVFIRILTPLYLKKYVEVIEDFLTTYHLQHFQNKGPNYKKVYQDVEKTCWILTITVLIISMLGAVLFNIPSLYMNLRDGVFDETLTENSTFHLAFELKYPGIDNYKHFTLLTFLLAYCSYNSAVAISANDLLLAIMVFHVIGHITLLVDDMENLPLPKTQNLQYRFHGKTYCLNAAMYDEDDNNLIYSKFIDFIEYHKEIVSFTKTISGCFGIMVSISYAFELSSGCLLMFLCSTGDLSVMITVVPMAFVIFSQLIIVSILFEKLTTKSEKLVSNLYLLPWECMNVRNRRMLLFILQRAQVIPIQVNAMGVVPVGVTTMAGILKTSFSYFMFLRSTTTQV